MKKQELLDSVQRSWENARARYVNAIARTASMSPNDDNFALIANIEDELDKLGILRLKVESQIPEDADCG